MLNLCLGAAQVLHVGSKKDPCLPRTIESTLHHGRGGRAPPRRSGDHGRLVEAREVAYVVAFLVSPKSVAINGDAISVGGGYRGPIYY